MYPTLKQRILAMPPGEAEALRAFYSDYDWENSIEVNGFPHQIPPEGDWRSWTVIGPPGTGKSFAGMHWIISVSDVSTTIAIVTRTRHEGHEVWQALVKTIRDLGRLGEYQIESDRITHVPNNLRLFFFDEKNLQGARGLKVHYVWADNVTDATIIRREFPTAHRFLFTGPVKLDPETIVSRAGDKRAVV